MITDSVANPLLEQYKAKWDSGKFDIVEVISATAREPQLALAFNYASLLLNNSYFLEGLVRCPYKAASVLSDTYRPPRKQPMYQSATHLCKRRLRVTQRAW